MNMPRFYEWSILSKIMAVSVSSIFLVSFVSIFYFSPRMERKMVESEENGLKDIVDVAFVILTNFDTMQREGRITEEEAHQYASDWLSDIRFHHGEYFFISDAVNGVLVMHPILPELVGKDRINEQDENGVYMHREILNVARTHGSGFVRYMWPRPGEEDPVQKVTYVRLFEPWGWILGGGIYVDDIKAEVLHMKMYLFYGTLIFAVLNLVFSHLIARGITKPLKKVINGLRDIAEGKGGVALTQRIEIKSIDEIGILSSGFNKVMESINNLSLFKKVIEEEYSAADVCIRLGEALNHYLGIENCIIFLARMDGYRCAGMNIVYPIGLDESEMNCDSLILGECDMCKARKHGHVISSQSYPSICRLFHSEPDRHHHCVPIVVEGRTVGVVQIVFDSTGWGTGGSEGISLFRAEQYIREAVPVIETKMLMSSLRESALIDQLTGLHNRRYLHEYTEKIVAGVVRRGHKIGVIMCDIDHFKRVNDMYSHSVGDTVLRETAEMIRHTVREADIVIRFGGEEFLVVLLDIGDGEAMMVAEKIRINVQGNKINLPDGAFNTTISLGVTEFPSDSESLWKCIRFADAALYRAKEEGRNRSVRFAPDMLKQDT